MFNPEKNNPTEVSQEKKNEKEASYSKESGATEERMKAQESEGEPMFEQDKYSPEARQEQITEQATMIREWAQGQGFEDGKDFL